MPMAAHSNLIGPRAVKNLSRAYFCPVAAARKTLGSLMAPLRAMLRSSWNRWTLTLSRITTRRGVMFTTNEEYTTNEEDQREAARLKARLAESKAPKTTSQFYRIPNVTIADGAHKYVLISAIIPGDGERQHFVVSRRGAAYHRNAAEPMVEALERSGYSSIQVLGGGRIFLDDDEKKISIFGYSYGFGLADHALSKSVVEADPRYKDYEITWSNDGY